MNNVLNIFNFLKQFNELSNPIITDLNSQRWSLNVYDVPKIREINSVLIDGDIENLTVLEVAKPILNLCPTPENFLNEWLNEDWRNLHIDSITYKESITRETFDDEGNKIYTEERFADDDKRVESYNKWNIQRNKWREIEIPKEQGLTLYNNLFKLYSEMKKESENVELILGDGILNWKLSTMNINHPILLQKVILEFDPNKPSFAIKCEEIKTEIYTSMLRNIPSINQMMLSDIIRDVEENSYSIADFENTIPLFKRIIHVIDNEGSFFEEQKAGIKAAQIYSSPIIFLRKRTLGFSTFIDGIIDEISQNDQISLPGFFSIMAGIHKEKFENEEIIEENWNQSGIDQEILLTLPANNEQLKIIKYLDKYGAVLVQGPPGTGKTHTIANLIGHLLSKGNSVLVTSHTEKALKVLKEKVYKDPYDKDINLQSLCISLLSSSSQKKEMDDAINEIAIKGTSLDLNDAQNKIHQLEKEREKLIEESKNLSKELLQIRALEYKDIVYNNQNIKPIDAARFIKDGIGKFDYINGTTTDPTIGLPIDIDELAFVYESNEILNITDEEVLELNIDISNFWESNYFQDKINSICKLEVETQNYISKLLIKEDVTKSNITKFLCKGKDLLNEIESFKHLEKSIINKTAVDIIYPRLWDDLLIEYDNLVKDYDSIRKIRLEEDFYILDEIINEDTLFILKEILESGKEKPFNKLTCLCKPKWKIVKDNITNDGKAIEKRKELLLVYDVILYEINKNKLLKKFNKLLIELKTDTIDDSEFELTLQQIKKSIIYSLSWYEEKWKPFINELKDYIKNDESFERLCTLNTHDALSSIKNLLELMIIPDIQTYISSINLIELQSEYNNYINNMKGYFGKIKLLNDFANATLDNNYKLYDDSYKTLKLILSKEEIFSKRKTILSKLELIAPIWVKDIEDRNGKHGQNTLPNNIFEAWRWRQLNNQLEKMDSFDPNKIQKNLSECNNRLLINARKLAYEKSWFEKIKNKTHAQSQAIEGWRTTIRQIGKGTGKKAPALQKKARELMPLCQSAIPIWIMPLNRVVENFNPQKNKFDVVIIDEASQANILALSALYLGKKVIIVGDDEQVSPDSIGLNKDEVDALILQYLEGVPSNHLYNGDTSLYDIAKLSGFKPLMLREHFRCLPEIIEFSNKLSYDGKIKPLREGSKVKIKPPVVEYRVPNATKNYKKINETEAEHIASLICALKEFPEYKDKSVGVISMLGNEQSYEIDKYLQLHMDPVEYEERKIQCGTPPQFQGDERDIIFISLVEGPNEKGGPVRLLSEDGNNDRTRKRYNVAASRAKDQMWVVHSLNPEIDLKPDDIRLRLINHAQNPDLNKNADLLKLAESPFEVDVMNALLNRGYKVIPQVKVGSYRIDMVIEDGDNKIALECDGEKYHTISDLPNDLKRQAILERLGWKFIRIRGSVYYREPIKTMSNVFLELERNGIKPNYNNEFIEKNELVIENNLILDKLKSRAAQIRQTWKSGTSEIEESQGDELKSEPTSELPEVKEIVSMYNLDLDQTAKKPNVKEEHKNEDTNKQLLIDDVIVNKKDSKKDKKTLDLDKNKEYEQNQALKKNSNKKENKDLKQESKDKHNNIQKPLFDFRKNK